MLLRAMEQGSKDALARFGVKEAGVIGDVAGGVGRALVGQPGRLFKEGPTAFRNGGFLSTKNVFWPATSGPGGSKFNWLQRAGTLAMPLQVMHGMKERPEEGTMSRLLGAAGGVAGMAYGYPALGMLGAPIAGAVGSRVGRGIGNLLSGDP